MEHGFIEKAMFNRDSRQLGLKVARWLD